MPRLRRRRHKPIGGERALLGRGVIHEPQETRFAVDVECETGELLDRRLLRGLQPILRRTSSGAAKKHPPRVAWMLFGARLGGHTPVPLRRARLEQLRASPTRLHRPHGRADALPRRHLMALPRWRMRPCGLPPKPTPRRAVARVGGKASRCRARQERQHPPRVVMRPSHEGTGRAQCLAGVASRGGSA